GEHDAMTTDEFVETRFDDAQSARRKTTERDAGLVRDDEQQESRVLQPAQRLADARYEDDAFGVDVVRDVVDERAVLVEEHRAPGRCGRIFPGGRTRRRAIPPRE